MKEKYHLGTFLGPQSKMIYGIIITVVVIAIMIGVYMYGKRKAEIDGVVDLPGDTDWGAALTEEESLKVSICANELYDDLKGVHFLGSRNKSPYEKMNLMSDKLLVAVANQFNELAKDDDETIVTWLDDDVFYGSLSTTVDNLINRLQNLGVK